MRLRVNPYRLFNIKATEYRPFSLLFTHAFFNGLAIALSFTAINILVLEAHGIENLPVLYIITSILLLAGGRLYSKLEHKYEANHLFLFSIVACIIWSFSFRFLLSIEHSIFFIGLAYCTYYLVLTLTNLDLWGAAALVFDIRQSKRLFGPISFGESIGFILGYSLTPLLIDWLSLHDVFVFAGISFILSIVFLQILNKLYLTHLIHDSHDQVKSKPQDAHLEKKHLSGYFNSLSAIIFLSTFVYVTITFGFLFKIEEDITDLKDIAIFIGVVLSASKVLNLFIKIFLSGRFLSTFGIRFSIAFLPTVILLISIAGLAGIGLNWDSYGYFIVLFSLIYLLDKIFRSSLYKPSYLVLFQPLSPHSRLEGHTITKGYFEPLGMGVAGILIFSLNYFDVLSLKILIVLIMLGSALWLILCWSIMSDYLQRLGFSLKSQLFGQKSYTLSKEEKQFLRDQKLHQPNPVAQLYAYSILSDELSPEESNEVMSNLLQSDDSLVLLESLKLMEKEKHSVPIDLLHNLLHHKDHSVRLQSAYTYSAIYESEATDIILEHARQRPSSNREMKGALLKYAGLKGTLSVGDDILELSSSASIDDRITACRIIGRVDHQDLNSITRSLIKDPSFEVRREILTACRRRIDPGILQKIIPMIKENRFLGIIKSIVAENQQDSQKITSEQYGSIDKKSKIRIINLCAVIHTSANENFLLGLLESNDQKIASAAISSLFTLQFKSSSNQISVISAAIRNRVTTSKKLLTDIEKLTTQPRLREAIINELKNIIQQDLLHLLSFLHPRDQILQIINNLKTGKKSYVSNAIELLDNTLTNRQSYNVIPIIERIAYIDGETYKPSKLTTSATTLLSDINTHNDYIVSDWLQAIALREACSDAATIDSTILENLQVQDSPYISEEINYYIEHKT